MIVRRRQRQRADAHDRRQPVEHRRIAPPHRL